MSLHYWYSMQSAFSSLNPNSVWMNLKSRGTYCACTQKITKKYLNFPKVYNELEKRAKCNVPPRTIRVNWSLILRLSLNFFYHAAFEVSKYPIFNIFCYDIGSITLFLGRTLFFLWLQAIFISLPLPQSGKIEHAGRDLKNVLKWKFNATPSARYIKA